MLLLSGDGITERSPIVLKKQCVSLGPCSQVTGRLLWSWRAGDLDTGCKCRLTTARWRRLKQRNGFSLGEDGNEASGSCVSGLRCQSFSWGSPAARRKMLVMAQGDIFSCDDCSWKASLIRTAPRCGLKTLYNQAEPVTCLFLGGMLPKLGPDQPVSAVLIDSRVLTPNCWRHHCISELGTWTSGADGW